jgi:parallel beta-helix repeat protein
LKIAVCEDRRMRGLGTLWLCLMLVLSILGMTMGFFGEVAAENPPVVDGGTTYWDQDWYVDDVQEYINQTIILSGNLTINETGSLTFYNVTLVMNCTFDGQYKIEVKSGSCLYISDNDNSRTTMNDASKITANNTDYEYLFWVRADSDFAMRNSELHECGYDRGPYGELAGLWVNANNSVIENNQITSNYNGIVLYQITSGIIKGNTITESRGKNGTDGTLGDGEPGDAGAGIYINSSENIDVADNVISNNKGGNGGKNGTNSSGGVGGLGAGIYVSTSNNITIKNNTILDNFGGEGGSTGPRYGPSSSLFHFNNSGGIGAGIYLFSSDGIIIDDNKISNNTGGSGGGILVDSDDYAFGNEGGNGAGIFLHDSLNNKIINNEISGNGGGDGGFLLQDMGGGIFVGIQMDGGTGAGVRLAKSTYNEIANNTIARSRGGEGTVHLIGNFGYYNAGIGLYLNGSHNRIINCTIWNNSWDTDGAGIYVASNYDQILNTRIENNYIGIYVLSSSITVFNSTILNSTAYDLQLSSNSIFMEEGIYFHTTAINTTFNESKVDLSSFGPSSYSDLTVQWYLSVYVNNTFGDTISGANVSVHDNGTFDHNYSTDSDGYIKWILTTEYIQNETSKIYYTPQNITATKSGYSTATVYLVINENTHVNLTLKDIEKPIANAGLDDTVIVSYPYTFNGSGSSDNAGIVNYAWDTVWSDGLDWNNPDYSGSDLWNPTHTYTEPGTYLVTLNVTDGVGNWDIDTLWLIVIDITPPILTDFTVTPVPQELHDYVNISVDVFDLFLYNAWVNITDPNGNTLGNFSMSYDHLTNSYYLNQTYDIAGTYHFVIWANDTGNLWNSTSGTFIMVTVPDPPTGLIATPGESYVLLTWSAPLYDGGSSITNYRIYRGTTSGDLSLLQEIENLTYYNDTSVENGLTYYYVIYTMNSVGESYHSIEVNATPDRDFDGDGIMDFEDDDDDNDEVPDEDDYYPLDPTKWKKRTKDEFNIYILFIILVVIIIASILTAILIKRKKYTESQTKQTENEEEEAEK